MNESKKSKRPNENKTHIVVPKNFKESIEVELFGHEVNLSPRTTTHHLLTLGYPIDLRDNYSSLHDLHRGIEVINDHFEEIQNFLELLSEVIGDTRDIQYLKTWSSDDTSSFYIEMQVPVDSKLFRSPILSIMSLYTYMVDITNKVYEELVPFEDNDSWESTQRQHCKELVSLVDYFESAKDLLDDRDYFLKHGDLDSFKEFLDEWYNSIVNDPKRNSSACRNMKTFLKLINTSVILSTDLLITRENFNVLPGKFAQFRNEYPEIYGIIGFWVFDSDEDL